MDRRLEGILHRWLPWVAGVAIGVALVSYIVHDEIFIEGKIREDEQKYMAEVAAPRPDPALLEARVGAIVEQAARLVTRLDSDVATQRALAETFGQDDTLQRLWVVDGQGNIVYYAKGQPAARTVEALAPRYAHALIGTLPPDLLHPEQRLAIRAAAAIREGLPDPGQRWELLMQQRWAMGISVPWSKPEVREPHIRLLPIKGGLISAVVQEPSIAVPPNSNAEISRLQDRQIFINGVALMIYWLAIPLWVMLDAPKYRERTLVWGLFTLIGNVVALLIYLLSRSRTEEQSAR